MDSFGRPRLARVEARCSFFDLLSAHAADLERSRRLDRVRTVGRESAPTDKRPLPLMGTPDRSGEHPICRMHGHRVGRGWMEPDTELRYPTASEVLWLLALILGAIVCIGVLQPSP